MSCRDQIRDSLLSTADYLRLRQKALDRIFQKMLTRDQTAAMHAHPMGLIRPSRGHKVKEKT
jgi:hypothetical protein